MMRSPKNPASIDEVLDPAIVAELDQLDAALRGEPIQDDVLAAIVRDVQATAPVMPDELRKQLRDDVADGFAKGGARGKLSSALGRTGRRGSTAPTRRTSFAFGGGLAATVLAVVGVGVVLTAGTSNKSLDLGDSSVSSAPSTVSESAAPSEDESSVFLSEPLDGDSAASATASGTAGATVPDAAPVPRASTANNLSPAQRALVDKTLQAQGSSGGSAAAKTPATGQRRVEQNVDLAVEVKSGKLPEATSKVEDIVRLGRGYVSNSQVSTGTRGGGSATYTLKVASSELDRTLKRLGDLGTVTSQQQASRDITSSFDSVQSRLDDNKQVRAALLKALAKADTDGEIGSLKARLADNRRTRESLESSLARLRTRTNLTTVALSLSAPTGDQAAADDDGNWSLGDAAHDAASALGAVTGVLLVGGAVLLPFGILAAIAWALYRVRRKRSRESALGD